MFSLTKQDAVETKAEAGKEMNVQVADSSSSYDSSRPYNFLDGNSFDTDEESYGVQPSEDWLALNDCSATYVNARGRAPSEAYSSSDEEEVEKNVGWKTMNNIGYKDRLGAKEDGMDEHLKPFPRSHGRNAGIGAEKKNPKTAGLVIKESKKQDLVAAMAEISKAKKEEKVLDLWKLSDIGLVGKFLYCQMTCDLENVADENLIKFDEGQRQRAVSKCKKLVARCGSFRALRERYDYCGRFYQLCMTLFLMASASPPSSIGEQN